MRHYKIRDTNGFPEPRVLFSAANDIRIAEIEGGGMDEGRVFLHTTSDYKFGDPYNTRSMSVGSVEELRCALGLIVRV